MFHYHMALKLEKRGRWLQVRRFLNEIYSMKVHFSDNHNTYYSTYKYVTKEDNECLHSEQHPDLSSPPKTERALASKKRKAREKHASRARKAYKRRGLTVYDVTQLMLAKKITTRLQLVCLSVEKANVSWRNLPTETTRLTKHCLSPRNFLKSKQNFFVQKSHESNSCSRQKRATAVKDAREHGLERRYEHCEIMEFQ